jgi:hypothetical protein
MTNFDKKALIHYNKQSITKELSEEIIENFINGKYEVNKIGASFQILETDKDWERIYSYLSLELKRNLKLYADNINIPFTKISQSFIPLNLKSLNISKFTITNVTYTKDDTFVNKKINIDKKEYSDNYFKFIWFLNDYNGEFLFWNDFTIKPNNGGFLLFPVSWCFPYSQIVKSDETQFIIQGYVHSVWNCP